MADSLLKFLDQSQKLPNKRPAQARRKDFDEIYGDYSSKDCQTQASRCSQCGVPFCQVHCPLNNNIPDWLLMAAENRWQSAYELVAETNNFPEICGRICPQDRLCEKNCVLEQADIGSVSIGAIERSITDKAWAEGWIKPRSPLREIPQSIGIVGSGPAGLAAAEELRALGFQVHIYERSDRAGGLLMYGIPSFKLEKDIVFRRTDLLTTAGVQFHLNYHVGVDETFEAFVNRHDAVLLAVGATAPKSSGVPSEGSCSNIIKAMDFLVASNRRGLGDECNLDPHSPLNSEGRRVVVIGGGDTAMDCVRTAIRQGAKKVTCLYRRDRENMPGSLRELSHAEEEGVHFEWLASPLKYEIQNEEISVTSIRNRLSRTAVNRRREPIAIEGSEFTLKADIVIEALGFDIENLIEKFEVDQFSVNRDLSTNMDGVFAAGDLAQGPSLVVAAIRDGRQAAKRIQSYLLQKSERRPNEAMA
ncbi:MAG: NAD(P)-dependent oxidoreductase [Oligoflexales bacterium]